VAVTILEVESEERDGLVHVALRGELDLSTLLRKRASVVASSLRARPAAEKAAIVASVRQRVWPMLDAGRVRPVVHSRHPLAEAASAHRELEAGAHVGKVLLTT